MTGKRPEHDEPLPRPALMPNVPLGFIVDHFFPVSRTTKLLEVRLLWSDIDGGQASPPLALGARRAGPPSTAHAPDGAPTTLGFRTSLHLAWTLPVSER